MTNDLTDQWRDRDTGQDRDWKPEGVGGLRQGPGPEPAWEGPPAPLCPSPEDRGRSPSTWPPEQLHSWLVSGFVIYYTKLKETTQALIVGTQTTRVAQKQVSRSWPQTGQEEHGRDLPAIDVPEMTNPPDYKPLGWSSRFPKPKTQEPNTSTGPS